MTNGLRPAETLTVGSLCSGYEATSLGLALAGWDHRLAFVADPDPAASKVLAHHHPDVPNLGDISRVAWEELGLAGEIDLLTAGFPCTDISCAGRRAGLGAGTRSGVWANVADAIDVLRPRLVLIENVAALLSTPANRSTDGTDGDMEPGPAGLGGGADRPVLRAIGAVLGDLSTLGFDAVWQVVSATEVGAPHLRKRVFILAWPAADPPRFGHRNARAASVRGIPAAAVRGGPSLNSLAANLLLPTPTAQHDARNATSGRSNPKPSTNTNGWTLADVAYADRWGEYAPAIARWEQVTGRPAPDPTEAGTKGQPRLAARFVEWMQGLPDGYVTAVPGISRNDALKLLGNANPPQQYAAAITQLAALVAHITATEAVA